MGEEGSLNGKTCRDPMGREESEEWCMDGMLTRMVIKGTTFLHRRVKS